MTRQIETSVRIEANPETIWQHLTNASAFPEWNPLIRLMQGKPEVGQSIRVHIQLPESSVMRFSPKVLCYEPGVEFRWKGKFLFRGLFDGEHYFRLIREAEGKTRFIHGEKFSGILVAPLLKMIAAKTEKGFERMNLALKQRCEKQ